MIDMIDESELIILFFIITDTQHSWGRCPVIYNNVLLYSDGENRRSSIELQSCLELSMTREFQQPESAEQKERERPVLYV